MKITEFEDKLARVRRERLEERRKQRVAQRRAEYIEDLQEEKRKEGEPVNLLVSARFVALHMLMCLFRGEKIGRREEKN